MLERRSEMLFKQFECKVKWSSSKKQKIEKIVGGNGDQSMAPAEDSPNNILNALNNDCLREIFDRDEIDSMDLAAIANTCTRFNAIAKRAFNKKYDEDLTKFKTADLWRVDEFLRTFGEQIPSVLFFGEFFGDRLDIVSRMILEHCINVTKLACSALNESSRVPLRRIVPQLQELTITNADEHASEIFDEETIYQLKKLHFIEFSSLNLPRAKMPELLDLCIGRGWFSFERNFHFFLLNPQIQVFSLAHVHPTHSIDSNQILRHLPNVNDLEIVDTAFNTRIGSLTSFGEFEHLNTLRLSIEYCDADTNNADIALGILQAIQNGNNHLENLSLKFWRGWDDAFIESICGLKNLKTLKIEEKLATIDENDDGLCRLVRELKQLECIHVEAVASLQGINAALRIADCMKKAFFRVTIIPGRVLPKLDSVIAEINGIRQMKGIELCIEIQIRPRAKNNIRCGTVSGFEA